MSFAFLRRRGLGAGGGGAPPAAARVPDLRTAAEAEQFRAFPLMTPGRGHRSARLPRGLRERLSRFWLAHRGHRGEGCAGEDADPRYISHETEGSPRTLLVPLQEQDPELEADLRDFVRRELQAWTGQRDLQHTATFGIREYTDGSILHTHVDRPDTHVLSAIIHVGSVGLKEPWDLQVQNRTMRCPENVRFTPDVDVILYESTTLAHGRTRPLRGERFANLFVHFAPRGWKGGGAGSPSSISTS